MFSLIIEILSKFVDIINENERISIQEKEKTSKILYEISEIILDTAVKLSRDEYPHNNCVVLERLSNNLHFNLLDYVDDKENDRLYDLLKDASSIEKLYAYRHNKDMINELMKISGEFRFASILLLS